MGTSYIKTVEIKPENAHKYINEIGKTVFLTREEAEAAMKKERRRARLKAYKAWDKGSVEPCSTVVFAENCKEAKKIARSTDACENADYINIRVQRFKQMDKHYRDKPEIDWYDTEHREALVSLGWMCLETSEECDACTARTFCGHWED